MIARARLRGARAREERFQGGPSRRLRKPLPHVREDRLGQHLVAAHPAGIVGCQVELRTSSSSMRTYFFADVVEGGGVLPILCGRVRHPHFIVSVAAQFELAVSGAACQRITGIAGMVCSAERPDNFDVVPALAADPNLIECVDRSALNLVVEAHPLLAVWILLAVGVGDDDAITVAACRRNFPSVILPGHRFFIANQYMHRARIDGLHATPP